MCQIKFKLIFCEFKFALCSIELRMNHICKYISYSYGTKIKSKLILIDILNLLNIIDYKKRKLKYFSLHLQKMISD